MHRSDSAVVNLFFPQSDMLRCIFFIRNKHSNYKSKFLQTMKLCLMSDTFLQNKEALYSNGFNAIRYTKNV